jgi:hypothetical protein
MSINFIGAWHKHLDTSSAFTTDVVRVRISKLMLFSNSRSMRKLSHLPLQYSCQPLVGGVSELARAIAGA